MSEGPETAKAAGAANESASGSATTNSGVDPAQAVQDDLLLEHPEYLIGAAFAGGIAVAQAIRWLTRG